MLFWQAEPPALFSSKVGALTFHRNETWVNCVSLRKQEFLFALYVYAMFFHSSLSYSALSKV